VESRWAAGFEPTPDDLALAHRSLLDTVAVTLAARDHRVTRLAAPLSDDARWAIAGHVPPVLCTSGDFAETGVSVLRPPTGTGNAFGLELLKVRRVNENRGVRE
jgi:hypothetical protein